MHILTATQSNDPSQDVEMEGRGHASVFGLLAVCSTNMFCPNLFGPYHQEGIVLLRMSVQRADGFIIQPACLSLRIH